MADGTKEESQGGYTVDPGRLDEVVRCLRDMRDSHLAPGRPAGPARVAAETAVPGDVFGFFPAAIALAEHHRRIATETITLLETLGAGLTSLYADLLRTALRFTGTEEDVSALVRGGGRE